jgi:hypothetical protein
MLEDLMDRPEGSLSGFATGGLFGNYLEQIIQQLSENDLK